MHFKHPELLYALFLLIVPVLVHLFQLRRFRTEKFTNVKFLRKASLQTRKSSQIKKWIVLSTRILLFNCLIIAFAQPFVPTSEESLMEQETVIYLDNSYSMQARGTQGILLRRAVQDILENLPQDREISLFTNDRDFGNTSINSVRKDLLQLPFSPQQLPWKSIGLKAEDAFSDPGGTHKNFIVISDFQEQEKTDFFSNERFDTHLVQLKPENPVNIAIDTAFISARDIEKSVLSVKLKAAGTTLTEIPVSLYDGDRLLAKKTVTLEDDGSLGRTSFDLPSSPIENGIVRIEENGLAFDNVLFFSINKKEPIEVVVIGDVDASFLQRIFKSPDFDLRLFSENQIEYSRLSEANLIILNEPRQLSSSLISSLASLVKENISLAIVPSEEADIGSYNSLLRNLGLPSLDEKVEAEKLVTEISFSSPLFQSVFQSEVENFQYPKVGLYYKLNGNAYSVLAYENQETFLLQREHVYLFTAPLSAENSNFQNSPLIVPTFYNMGNLSMVPLDLYYLLGESNKIDVKVALETDEILKLSNSETSFIPLQQNYPNKVEIQLNESPKEAGHYQFFRDSISLKNISFNVNRQEGRLDYLELENSDALTISNSVPEIIQFIESKDDINSLWKWFVIFALVFLFTEMLLLKFYK